MSSKILHPEVLWAQRSSADEAEKNIVYLTINASDLQNPKVELKENIVGVDGVQKGTDAEYKAHIELFEAIDVKESKYHTTDRGVIFILRKSTQKLEYWPRLTKSTKKEHFIRTDFDKWVDEDDQSPDASDPLSFPTGPGGMPDMGDLDFSKLGGGAGLGDDMGGFGGEDDEDDVADLPELTSEDKEELEGKGKEKAAE